MQAEAQALCSAQKGDGSSTGWWQARVPATSLLEHDDACKGLAATAAGSSSRGG